MSEKSDKVVFATADVTVHEVLVEDGNGMFGVTSHTLSAGDTFPFDKLPPYQKEKVEAGEVNGLEVTTQEDADKRVAEARKVLDLAQGQANLTISDTLSGPDADDGSFPDHLVPDDVRRAQQRDVAEAAEGDASDPSHTKASRTKTVKDEDKSEESK